MREASLARRVFLAVGATTLVSILGGLAIAGERAFTLKETAGLRRFGYPVYTTIPIDPSALKFRLERNGQPVPAQFRAIDSGDGKVITALDFNASPGPLESESYVVRYGSDVKPGPEPKGGMSVERGNRVWIIRNKEALSYEIHDDLGALPHSVVSGGVEFLKPNKIGLLLFGRNGFGRSLEGEEVAGGKINNPGSVTREGPLAVGLRFQGWTELNELGRVNSTVEMTFPSSKSWVEVRWTVDDPEGFVGRMSASLKLKLEGAPISLDFGAHNTVYGSIRNQEVMGLEAGDAIGFPPMKGAWHINKFNNEVRVNPRAITFATSHGLNAPLAEGWVHVMDKTRCTAVAIERFGRASRDGIGVRAADGGVDLSRSFVVKRKAENLEPPKGPKSLHFWLHFVPMPVQVGAVTSPQAMLAPLVVEWDKAKGG